ncbi:MAG: hypothetical protein ACOYM3_01075 [Terrimicrobiaceae bacterium]
MTSVFALTCGVMFSLFVMGWVITGDPRMSATIVTTAFTTILLIGFGWAMSHISHRKNALPPDAPDYQVIQPAPARIQLPSPRYIDVPTYHANGQPQPLAAEIVLRSNDADGQPLEVPYRYLLRFARCITPKREEWTGKPQQFYQCQAWFDAHGFLQPQGQTRVWRPEYPLPSRLEWLQQFEPLTPVTGNR